MNTAIVEYVVVAEYSVTKELIVTVHKGDNPLDPAAWIDIVDERDIDCHLEDTVSFSENA